VCGGRDFDSWKVLQEVLKDEVGSFRGPNPEIVIIQGGAKGADFLAKVYAKWVGWSCEEYPANWKKHGKAAGGIRNQQMLDEGKPDVVVAFPGGIGTADMIRRAKKAGVEVLEVEGDE